MLALEAPNATQREIAEIYHVFKSTLGDWAKDKKDNRPYVMDTGKLTDLTQSHENMIVTALIYLDNCGFPIDREILAGLVHAFCKFTNLKYFVDKKPRKDWLNAFYKKA